MLQFLFKLFGYRDFLPSNELTRWMADFVCQPEDLAFFCADFVFVIAGFDRAQLNKVGALRIIFTNRTLEKFLFQITIKNPAYKPCACVYFKGINY